MVNANTIGRSVYVLSTILLGQRHKKGNFAFKMHHLIFYFQSFPQLLRCKLDFFATKFN